MTNNGSLDFILFVSFWIILYVFVARYKSSTVDRGKLRPGFHIRDGIELPSAECNWKQFVEVSTKSFRQISSKEIS